MTEPTGKVRLCAADEVQSGAMLQVNVEGMPPLVVYRVGNEYYCTQDLCTHGASSLGDEGDLEGYIIECTWHNGKFDVRTGEPCALPCVEALRTFPVVLDGADVFINVV